MASPLFNPQNRPKDPVNIGEAEIKRFQAERSQEAPIVVSVATAPGLFELAAKADTLGEGLSFRVPASWAANPPRIHVIPAEVDNSIKNGRAIVTIRQPRSVTSLIIRAFRELGCEVIEGTPSRFERKPVI